MNRFTIERGDLIMAQCSVCRNHRGDGTCAAFPRRIPKAILTNEHDHREPYPGDNGVRFEPVDDEAAQIVAQVFEEPEGE